MKKYLFVLLLLLNAFINLNATHNRAGQIEIKWIEGYTFEVTIITYTNTKPTSLGQQPADRPNLQVSWGDNTDSIIERMQYVDLPENIRWNKYVGNHTYQGPGIYKIVMMDPYRNKEIINMPNPLNQLFTLTKTILINSDDNTKKYYGTQYTSPPITKSFGNSYFAHDFSAYSPSGAKMKYELTKSKAEHGDDIVGFEFPPGISINENTGRISWFTPDTVGAYNFAVLVKCYFNDTILFTTTTREIQILLEKGPSPVHKLKIENSKFKSDSTFGTNIIYHDSINDLYYARVLPIEDLNVKASIFSKENNVDLEFYFPILENANLLNTNKKYISENVLECEMNWQPTAEYESSIPHIFVIRKKISAQNIENWKSDALLFVCVGDSCKFGNEKIDSIPYPPSQQISSIEKDNDNYAKNKKLINVYPNPTEGSFNINVDKYYSNLEISIYNSSGLMVYLKDVGHSNQISVKNLSLPAGIYYIKLKNNDKEIGSGSVIFK